MVLDGDIDGSEAVLSGWPPGSRRCPCGWWSSPRTGAAPAALNAGFAEATGRGPGPVRRRPDAPAGLRRAARRRVTVTDRRGVIGMCRNVFPETPYAPGLRPTRLRPASAETPTVAPPEVRLALLGRQRVGRPRVVGGGRTVRRVAFRAYGWEDVDWGYRLTQARRSPSCVDPGLETDHHIASTSTRDRALRAYYSGSARHRFEAKHGAAVVAAAPSLSTRGWLAVTGTLARAAGTAVGLVAGLSTGALPVLPRRFGAKARRVARRGGRPGRLRDGPTQDGRSEWPATTPPQRDPRSARHFLRGSPSFPSGNVDMQGTLTPWGSSVAGSSGSRVHSFGGNTHMTLLDNAVRRMASTGVVALCAAHPARRGHRRSVVLAVAT